MRATVAHFILYSSRKFYHIFLRFFCTIPFHRDPLSWFFFTYGNRHVSIMYAQCNICFPLSAATCLLLWSLVLGILFHLEFELLIPSSVLRFLTLEGVKHFYWSCSYMFIRNRVLFFLFRGHFIPLFGATLIAGHVFQLTTSVYDSMESVAYKNMTSCSRTARTIFTGHSTFSGYFHIHLHSPVPVL